MLDTQTQRGPAADVNPADVNPADVDPAIANPAPAANPEAELARRFVMETDRHVFLTGRAGTGKTTFLHDLRRRLRKSYVVVAPTGVAAINAGGTTIHSQLQLPFGTLTPERMNGPEGRRRLAKQKEQVLRRIDLLVIDEVSMVRADVMDAIDLRLRRVRRDARPFGGVQLLLIGDLHQLPPVVTDAEAGEMSRRYDSPYFFSAKALQQAGLVTVELRHVYRQTDADFIQVLGEVRANRMTPAVLERLNARYRPGVVADALPGYVTLSTHRRTADDTNARRLAATPGTTHTYRAVVTGTYPEGSYPTDATLGLKLGAQVMFVKNDRDGAYHNGKLGTVTALDDDAVTVDCGPDEGGEIRVGLVRWENARYSLDAGTKEVSSEVAGSFTQVPLRLAWAITIHKSQGLTFDKVVIDAAAAFAHGQVYVALSRCRSLGGIILQTEIAGRSVHTDRQVSAYTEQQRERRPTADTLAAARVAYHAQLITGAFDFARLAHAAEQFRRHGLTEERAYPGLEPAHLDAVVNHVGDKCVAVARRFVHGQLRDALAAADLSGAGTPVSVPVPERCRQAAAYFAERLAELTSLLDALDLETDNADTEARGRELLAELRAALALRSLAVRAVSGESFTPAAYVAERAKATLDAERPGEAKTGGRLSALGASVRYPLLYAMLTDWRTARARALEVRSREVVPTRTLRAVADARPTTAKQLRVIAGLGATTAASYGAELLEVVARYAELEASGKLPAAAAAKGADAAPAAQGGDRAGAKAKPSVSTTVSLSLSMFRTGSSVGEIAAERKLKPATIYGHLAAGVDAGVTDAAGALPEADVKRIHAYFAERDGDLGGAFGHFDGAYDNGELKLARALWRRAKSTPLRG